MEGYQTANTIKAGRLKKMYLVIMNIANREKTDKQTNYTKDTERRRGLEHKVQLTTYALRLGSKGKYISTHAHTPSTRLGNCMQGRI